MISESGVSGLISEYPPGIQSGQKWTFAQRNRIISGISPALVVIQAPKGSGAMITARYAIEQNRDVFVCSGHAFDENYGGCHELIRDGASIVSQVEDILSVIDPEYKMAERGAGSETSGKTGEILINTGRVTVEKQVKPDFSLYTGIERDLLESVFSGITDIDLFTRKHSFSPDTVLRAITALEIEGVITRKGNKIVMK
jgi:predicted Rossmann fold nucleotide-binding protein DprA/Smf involved in DNA uptake